MSDYSELKRLADSATQGIWGYSGSYIAPLRTEKDGASYVEMWRPVAQANNPENSKFIAAANPSAVLALIAEVEALRKDKERLDALEANFWDVRNITRENGDGGDSSVRIEVVGHWMEKPWERVIGENYSENLRAAIDQATTADAYPPGRPEYEEDEL